MYLESLIIKNYRKFHSANNMVCFVKPNVIDINTEVEKSSVIAPSTTLIIGKNNSGKTTVINALKMLIQNTQPLASDFNLFYLNELFNKYKNSFKIDENTKFEELETPNLEFVLRIKVDFNDEDLMTNLSPFISISEDGDGKPVSVEIGINVILVEEYLFKEEVKKIFKETSLKGDGLESKKLFESFYEMLSRATSALKTEGNLYKTVFIGVSDDIAEKFPLKKLIKIKEIKANRHLKEDVLSNIFNKIISFQFYNDMISRSELDESIVLINEQISEKIGPKSSNISQVLGEIENSSQVDLNLSGNVTYDAIMKGLIKYNFMDGDDYIPEDQFGLGYINLLNIIGEIIHFVDSYENKSHLSCINLLFIEEPEAFMHPQMQEFFIKRIDNAVKKALEIANNTSKEKKTLQCQIIITTHSSHIVNSKIHSSNTFNNLNYLTSIDKCTKAVNLTDDALVISEDFDAQKKLNFIKKHIKHRISELFFSDAIIFVEGITEETLLNYYIDNHPILCNYYISVFNINGAHGKLYLPLAKKLSVPSLIVTDLDIKREKCEKNEKHKKNESCQKCGQQAEIDNKPFVSGVSSSFVQITDLHGRTTTNATLKELNLQLKKKPEIEADRLDNIDFFEDENFYVVFQKEQIEGQHATSFEEALILTNYENDILNNALKECKPNIYKKILGTGDKESRINLINHSYYLQKTLSDSKSEFSNKLLFSFLAAEEYVILPKLPIYIENGLTFLANKLQANNISK